MEKTNVKVLGFLPLLALVVGSIVGAGIFNSPADLGSLANPGWITIAWGLTAIGVFSLVRVFQYVNIRRPDLEGGIYTYAREIAGEFTGFNSALGYWWSSLFTNLAYLFAIPKILSYYFPVLASNKWAAFALATTLLWLYHILIASGIRTAGMANVFITILKLTPLIFVVGVTLFMFKPSLIGDPFGVILNSNGATATPWAQIGGSFAITVFAFLGIESAVVFSGKATSSRDIGRVTFIGFIITLIIYILISTLTMGVAPASEIVNASSPLGAVLGYAIGGFGRHFLNFGFLFSVMGALLSWLLLTAEITYCSATTDGSFPKAFARMNRQATPIFSLTITNIITQIILILLYSFAQSADIRAAGNAPLLQNLYSAAINLSVVCIMVPYVLSSALGFKMAFKEKVKSTMIYGLISGLFFCWVFFTTAKYLAAAIIIYTTGWIFRFFVFRDRQQKFPRGEKIFYILMLLGSIVISYFIGNGQIQF